MAPSEATFSPHHGACRTAKRGPAFSDVRATVCLTRNLSPLPFHGVFLHQKQASEPMQSREWGLPWVAKTPGAQHREPKLKPLVRELESAGCNGD